MNENIIPAAQEAQEHQMLNNATRSNREKNGRNSAAVQTEQENQHRIAAIKRMAMHTTLWVIGCATLIILAHIGDIADWLMYVGTTAWSCTFGFQVGRDLD